MIDLKKPMIECMYFIDPRLEIRAIWDLIHLNISL